jgi:Zn-dependent peptidase ImmA (M78 family)
MTERIAGVNRSRVEWCCDEHHLSVAELFAHLKISDQTRDDFLHNGPALTFLQLEKIADYFDRGVLFFLEAGAVDPERAHSPQFRTIANQKPLLSSKLKLLIERAEKQREIYLAVQEELGEEAWKTWRTRLPANVLTGNTQERALAIRAWLGLDGVNDFDAYRDKVEAQGVLVFLSNGHAGSWQIPKENTIRGFSLVHEIHPLIFVKKQQFPAPQTFTLFHELAHLILHDRSFADEDDDLISYEGKELEANALAGLILVPDNFLVQVDTARLRLNEPENLDDDLRRYRNAWGVSSEVILRRLFDEGKITEGYYRGYRKWQSDHPIAEQSGGGARYRQFEPLRIFGRMFVGKILEALSGERVTLNKASGFLDNIKISDIHKLEERCAHL